MKKLIKKYGHIWMLSYAFIYLPWFSRLQENVNKPYHVMHTVLDDLIPFNEYFIVPYLMWFLYVAATIAFFFFKNRDDYYRLCTFLFTGMTISLLVCTLFPNGTDFRPAIDPDKNIFCYLVSRLWSIDPCINVFPSIHVYNSVGVHIAICHSEELKKHPMIVRASGVLMVLICLATMFLKQHSVIDVVGALLMASVIYPIAYAPEAEKKYLQDSFSAVLFFRAKMKIVASDRARRENVPRHIRSSPLCLPGLTSSSRKCPVPACQCFLSRIFTAIENSRPPARTCAQKGGCLTIVFLIF